VPEVSASAKHLTYLVAIVINNSCAVILYMCVCVCVCVCVCASVSLIYACKYNENSHAYIQITIPC
jgi:hypothetical protein